MAVFRATPGTYNPFHNWYNDGYVYEVEIELPAREDLTQQHGYLHAGIATTVADSAGGYASYSLMPAGSSVLAVEFKVNLLAPGRGELFRARGRVQRPGRRIFVAEIEVEALEAGSWTRTLTGLQTSICLHDTPDDAGRGS